MKKKLSEIATIGAGQGAPQGDTNYSTIGVPFVKAGNLKDLNNGMSIDSIQHVSDEVAKKHKLKLFPKGTILFAKSGMSCLKGYVYVLPIDAYVVNHLACIVPNDSISEYLKYFFNYNKPNQLVNDGSYPSIRLSDIGNLKVNLPNIETRNKIERNLDNVSQIIALKIQQLNEYDQLIKSRFVEMFEDEIKETRLEDVCLGITDGSHNPPKGVDYSEYVMLSSQNINDRQISLDNPRYLSNEDYQKENRRTQIKTGDVLLTIVGSIGRTAVVPKDFGKLTLQRSVAVLHPNFSKVASTYLEQALVYIRHIIESESNGVAQKGIYLKQVRNLMIKLPPLETQKKYEDFIQQVDKLKFEVQKSLDETQTLFDSLMQNYFE